MNNRKFNFIAELPSGYEYKLVQVEDQLKVIGVHPEKEPIGFVITSEYKLEPIKL